MNILKLALALLVLIIAVCIWRMSPLLNFDYATTSPNPDNCVGIDGPIGAEDITIDQSNGIAYLAADDRRAYLTVGSRAPENGALWSINLEGDSLKASRINADYPAIFHPHGISLLKEGEKQFLFVINHPSTTEHQIDIFELTDPNSAKLVESIRFPELTSPNDLHAVSRTSFYITNDHNSPRQTLGEKVEDFFRLASTNVLFYNNGDVSEVIDDLYMANGIVTNTNQTTLFVSESTGERISVYGRDDTSGQNWKLEKQIPLNVMPDNLEWGSDGKLLVASHPKALDFLLHTFDESVDAPSIAHSVDIVSGEAETIYADDGSTLSGSSVAASYKDQLLIGSVFEPKFVHCKTQRVATR